MKPREKVGFRDILADDRAIGVVGKQEEESLVNSKTSHSGDRQRLYFTSAKNACGAVPKVRTPKSQVRSPADFLAACQLFTQPYGDDAGDAATE